MRSLQQNSAVSRKITPFWGSEAAGRDLYDLTDGVSQQKNSKKTLPEDLTVFFRRDSVQICAEKRRNRSKKSPAAPNIGSILYIYPVLQIIFLRRDEISHKM
jgi:hypothetical protein